MAIMMKMKVVLNFRPLKLQIQIIQNILKLKASKRSDFELSSWMNLNLKLGT